jgi:hypothetical protein
VDVLLSGVRSFPAGPVQRTFGTSRSKELEGVPLCLMGGGKKPGRDIDRKGAFVAPVMSAHITHSMEL